MKRGLFFSAMEEKRESSDQNRALRQPDFGFSNGFSSWKYEQEVQSIKNAESIWILVCNRAAAYRPRVRKTNIRRP